MAYTKQNFKDGDVLSASQLNNMDEELARLGSVAVSATKQISEVSAGLTNLQNDIDNFEQRLLGIDGTIASVRNDVSTLQNGADLLQKQADDTQRSLDALWKLSKGQIYDIEQVECEGHAQLPTGGEFGNIDEAYGKTEQESTEGRQLLLRPENDVVYSTSGVTATYRASDGAIIFNGTATGSSATIAIPYYQLPVEPDTQYTLSMTPRSAYSDKKIYLQYWGSNTGGHKANNSNGYVTFTTSTIRDVQPNIGFGVTVGGVYDNYIVYPLLERGSIAHPYEPYTGGIPSPNPDYPQEIKSVEEIYIRKTGKNLIPNNWVQGMLDLADGKNLIPNYHWVSLNEYIPCPFKSCKLSAAIVNKLCLLCYDGKYSYLGYIQPMKYNNKVSVAMLSGTKYLRVAFNVDGALVQITPDNMEEYDVQLLFSDSFTPYEPYYEETRIIVPPRPLNAIGEYRDVCDVVEGVWKYETAERVDTKALSLQSVNSHGIANFILPAITDGKVDWAYGNDGIAFVCDHFLLTTVLIAQATSCGMLRNFEGTSFVRFYASEVPTLQKANEWLEEHRPKTVYVLAQPVTEPISSSDLSYLRNLTLLPGENLFITDNHGRDVSYLMSDIINLGKVGESK